MKTFKSWNELCDFLEGKFGIDIDLNGVLFLIGIREKGLTFQKFTKEEKISLINLGSCTLYQEKGLVERYGEDKDGWPLFRQKSLAALIPEELKLKTLQDCAMLYFSKVFE